jgi:hypothetical protein
MPRLNATVRTTSPGFMAVNSGPVAKLGNYGIAFEIGNRGHGFANNVRVSVVGMNDTKTFQSLEPNARSSIRFSWNLENQPAYRTRPETPEIIIGYEDDASVKYEQRGTLNVTEQKDGTFHYDCHGIGAPRRIA